MRSCRTSRIHLHHCIRTLSNRIVLDIWGGRYADIASNFEVLASYGINHCVAIIHDWQRSGYDNALAGHFPAAADKGGDDAMKGLWSRPARAWDTSLRCTKTTLTTTPTTIIFASLTSRWTRPESGRTPGTIPGTKIQSFAVKPNAILPLAATQSPEIHRRYGTNSCFLDVSSAVPPWFHVDQRSGEEGAGTFHRVWDVHRKLWDYERKTHGGPVFGEGNNHWYWSGYLDGAEAQLGSGWPTEAGRSYPCWSTSTCSRSTRFRSTTAWVITSDGGASPPGDPIPPLVVLDQYRMQEVAFGHAGFLGTAAWSVIPLAWLEHHLLTPVMARYRHSAGPSPLSTT